MLKSINEIIGYDIISNEKEDIGKVADFYFDDDTWVVRYLVVDTGSWLRERKVLISPEALENPDWMNKNLPVNLTAEGIENSPPVDKEKPVSRQFEKDLHKYYGWYPYWAMDSFGILAARMQRKKKRQNDADPHLRSAREIEGYHIHAEDGQVGHVEDFIVEDATWIIRYMVVDTRNILPGKKVLLSPEWITDIDWREAFVFVDMDKESVKNSPEFNPSDPVNRDYEITLYDYYGRPKYWLRK